MQDKRRIGIVGATGSIGKNAYELLRTTLSGNFTVEFLVCNNNLQEILEQINFLKPKAVCVGKEIYFDVKKNANNVEVFDDISQILEKYKTDVTLYALSGVVGVEYILKAIANTKILAIANKEAIVSAWQFMEEESIKHGTQIIPVDSEHNCLYRLLEVFDSSVIDSVAITASGGPFFGKKYHDLQNITPKDALKHPTWPMGVKNTIDSATMANKVLELIEAMNLFNYAQEKIDVYVNRQSVIHASVVLKSGGVVSFGLKPDMKLHIGHAIMFPEYVVPAENILQNCVLEFCEIKKDEFPIFFFGREIAQKESIYHTVFNIANEVAVKKFVNGEIKYTDILPFIEKSCEKNQHKTPTTIEECVEICRSLPKELQAL
jgi:1-deoxy-D-xylulose-5-phosphate reductoisomerase